MFARGSSPQIDRPILRKSKLYVEDQVSIGRAEWVDANDHTKGILCRELLYFGPPDALGYDPLPLGSRLKLAPLELPGLIFREPQSIEWQRDHKLGPTIRFLESLTA